MPDYPLCKPEEEVGKWQSSPPCGLMAEASHVALQ